MAFAGIQFSSKIGQTLEQLKLIYDNDDPIELLFLAAGQEGLNVKYNDILSEPSLGTFMCSVEVGKLFTSQDIIGYGTNKKEAKRNAAQEAIIELIQRMKDLSPSSPASVKPSTSTSMDIEEVESDLLPSRSQRTRSPVKLPKTDRKNDFTSNWMDSLLSDRQSSSLASLAARGSQASKLPNESLSDNPIGELKELADTRGWLQPIYEEIDEYGEDHRKTFVIQCKFRDTMTEAAAANKKTAKKNAAEEMLAQITGRKGTSKDSSSSPNHVSSTSRRRNYDVIQKETDYHIKKLKKYEKKWPIQWHDLGTGYKGNSLCFVRIKTDPVTVCSGSGITEQSAHNEAARNALKILKQL